LFTTIQECKEKATKSKEALDKMNKAVELAKGIELNVTKASNQIQSVGPKFVSFRV